MNTLFLLQFGCLIITGLLALVLMLSGFATERENALYERSRRLIVAALLLLTVHYVLQIVCGFRAQGDDVGALVNILFYAPAIFLLSLSMRCLMLSSRSVRRYSLVSLGFYVALLLTVAVGVFIYRSLHLRHALHALALIYLCFIVYSCTSLIRSYRRVRRTLDSDMGNPVSNINRWTLTGAAMLSLQGVLTPFVIFSRMALLIAGPVILLTIIFFVSTFLALGYNYYIQEILTLDNMRKEEGVTDDEKNDEESEVATACVEPLSAEQIQQMEELLTAWRASHGYRDNELTIASLARRLKVSRALLSQFLTQHYHSTFRSWLSAVRIEESKCFMTEHPAYSNEFIAMECGFASRTHFQRLFKASEGVTPSEWKRRRG